MESSRPEYPPSGDLPNTGIKSRSLLYRLSPQGSPRILEWVVYLFSRGSSQPRNWTGVCLRYRRILYQLSYQGSPRIPEWVAYLFSTGSSQPRSWTGVSCVTGGFFTSWATREALLKKLLLLKWLFCCFCCWERLRVFWRLKQWNSEEEDMKVP